ncbi:hypothetical protein [Sporosarcina sp. YIM B06819]|uniref:hypothetical protein n=1 Tax=Sporosarcina sp. YIM B06819 TaxID=3081769 RepID=UPI00298C9784|nr:hypothetical protein [Sporosarcina sp. YIM B06819]
MLKKYVIFLVIFMVLYVALQVLVGVILTAIYQPDVTSGMNNFVYKLGGFTPVLSIIAAAVISNFLTQKLSKKLKIRTN